MKRHLNTLFVTLEGAYLRKLGPSGNGDDWFRVEFMIDEFPYYGHVLNSEDFFKEEIYDPITFNRIYNRKLIQHQWETEVAYELRNNGVKTLGVYVSSEDAAANNFERNLLLIGAIGALREINDTHTAAAELGQDPPGSDHLAVRQPHRRGIQADVCNRQRMIEHAVLAVIGGQHCLDFLPQSVVSAASGIEKSGSLRRRFFQSCVKQGFDLFPATSCFPFSHPGSSEQALIAIVGPQVTSGKGFAETRCCNW